MPAPTVSFVASSIRMNAPVRAVVGIGIDRERLAQAQPDAGDVVQLEVRRLALVLERVDVDHGDELVDDRAHRARRVLDHELRPRLERLLGHPADRRLELARDGGRLRRVGEHVAAGDVEVVGEPDRHGHARNGQVERCLGVLHRGNGRPPPRRKHDDVVACLPDAARHLAGVAAEVVMLVRDRPDHPLDGEAAVVEIAVAGDLDRLEVLEQGRAVVPGHSLAARDDVVATKCRQRNHGNVTEPEPLARPAQLLLDLEEARLGEAGEVHLVDGDDDVRDAEDRRDVRSGGASARSRPCARRRG